MLRISGKFILSKYNTMESITTDCRMFWPGRPLLVSCTRRSGFRGGWKGETSADFHQVLVARWNATITRRHSTYQCVFELV